MKKTVKLYKNFVLVNMGFSIMGLNLNPGSIIY